MEFCFPSLHYGLSLNVVTPAPKAQGPCPLFVFSIIALLLFDHRVQGKGCVHCWDEEAKPVSFVSETVFFGSQGGDRLLQGISCPGVYIWFQKKEREVGKAVGWRSGGTGSKRVRNKTAGQEREAGGGACPFSQVSLNVLPKLGMGKLSAL